MDVSTNAGLSVCDSVKAHPRNVTDIDWCDASSSPQRLVSCSLDDAVNVWDVRDFRKPKIALHVVAGAVQAKWSPFFDYLLATAHGTDVRVWDIRVSIGNV